MTGCWRVIMMQLFVSGCLTVLLQMLRKYPGHSGVINDES